MSLEALTDQLATIEVIDLGFTSVKCVYTFVNIWDFYAHLSTLTFKASTNTDGDQQDARFD